MKCQTVSLRPRLSKYSRIVNAPRGSTMKAALMPWRSVLEQKPKSDKFSPNISRLTRSAPEPSWPAPMKFSTEWDNTTREDERENLRTFNKSSSSQSPKSQIQVQSLKPKVQRKGTGTGAENTILPTYHHP